MSRLNKVLQQNNVTEHKKKKAKQKKTVMPVYDLSLIHIYSISRYAYNSFN